jgi:hypothetical protein
MWFWAVPRIIKSALCHGQLTLRLTLYTKQPFDWVRIAKLLALVHGNFPPGIAVRTLLFEALTAFLFIHIQYE